MVEVTGIHGQSSLMMVSHGEIMWFKKDTGNHVFLSHLLKHSFIQNMVIIATYYIYLSDYQEP